MTARPCASRSVERIAYPSMAALVWFGTSIGDCRLSAKTRPNASRKGTDSVFEIGVIIPSIFSRALFTDIKFD